MFTIPAGSEPAMPSPTVHEESARTLEEVSRHLQDQAARWREHFSGAGSPTRPLISFMLRYRDDLGLSPNQIESLERLRADFTREWTPRQTTLRSLETELGNLLNADPVDLAQVEAKIREIERLRSDLTLSRIRTIELGKAQLSSDQRAKLKSLLASPRPAPQRTKASLN